MTSTKDPRNLPAEYARRWVEADPQIEEPEYPNPGLQGVNLRGISRIYPIPDGEPEWGYEAHPDGGLDEVPLWREGNRERLYWLIDFISMEGPSKYPAVWEWEERRLQYRRDWLQRMILECRNEPMLAGFSTLPRRRDELAQIDSLFMMHAAYARDLLKEDALRRLDTEAVEFQTAATNNRRLAYPWEAALGPPVDAPAFNFNTRTARLLEMELGALVGRAHSLSALLAQREVRRFHQERTRELIAKHRRGLIAARTTARLLTTTWGGRTSHRDGRGAARTATPSTVRELHDFLEIHLRTGEEAQAESQNRAHVGDFRGEDYPQMADSFAADATPTAARAAPGTGGRGRDAAVPSAGLGGLPRVEPAT
ncbi:hypothetical protein KFL_005910010 [Klebsormidium nitens]|uniref:Uncharacterized protein n=1 Tax=Klebsormidium nitens TaxID=105231 RepID=A0A1Y1IGL3_KLENI|nr:hypothetical protein KFL_005910010 [Klebsormidium nitens]|eukprot:GAQ90024.1 hypothetical protein KFL_005910010 [Klebsormidium nitens]